jgi:phosphoglycerol transferase
MKGREADWQEQLVDLAPVALVRSLAAVGYQGILIDRFGYADRAEALAAALVDATGAQPLLSPDGRWWFFSMVDLRSRFDPAEMDELRDELLHAPRLVLGGCASTEEAPPDRFQWCGVDVDVSVARSTGPYDPFTYTFDVDAPGGDGELVVDLDGEQHTFAIGPTRTTITLDVPGGEGVDVTMHAEVAAVVAPGDPRDLRFRVIDPQVTDSAP